MRAVPLLVVMLGAPTGFGLWAASAHAAPSDTAQIERARDLIRTAQYQAALDALRPIAESPERRDALGPDQAVVLYYALGRAHQELGAACAARAAFDEALAQPALRDAQRARIDERQAALALQLTGELRITCAGAATVDQQTRPCGETHTLRTGTHAVTVALRNGLTYPTAAVAVPACETTEYVAPAPALLRFVGPPAARVYVDDVAVSMGGDPTTEVPPGLRRVRVEDHGEIITERQMDFAPGVESVLTPPAPPTAVTPERPATGSATFWTFATIGGLSLAAAGVTAVFAADAANQHADLQRAYDEGRAGTDFAELRAQMGTQEDRANTLYLVAGGLAGAAVASGIVAALVYPDDPASVSVIPTTEGLAIGGVF